MSIAAGEDGLLEGLFSLPPRYHYTYSEYMQYITLRGNAPSDEAYQAQPRGSCRRGAISRGSPPSPTLFDGVVSGPRRKPMAMRL